MDANEGAALSGCGRTACFATSAYRVSAFSLAPGYSYGHHAHERGGLVLTLRGRWDGRTRSRGLSVAAGYVAVLPPGVPHCESAGMEGADVLLIEPADDLEIDGLAALFSDLQNRQLNALSAVLPHLWYEVHDEPGSVAVEALCTELLLLVHADTTTASIRERWTRTPPRWVHDAVTLLTMDSAADRTLKALAADLGVSPEHLARSFRRYVGCTMGDFLRRSRVLAAARALRDTPTPIGGIACRAGFADQSHLTRMFRRYMGMTPAAYRERFDSS